MINIWCVCVGDKYSFKRVDMLNYMVDKNINQPYMFNVLTKSDKPGWWSKLDLFNNPGPSLYFDLDTVIVNDLTPLANYTNEPIAATKNWAKSGNGGFQSSVLAWSKKRKDIPAAFDQSRLGPPDGPEHCKNFGWYNEEDGSKHWGDQEFITHRYGEEITEIDPGLVVSYKYHCQNKLPDKAIVVCFHGKPDYWEVKHDWIDQALS